MNFRKNVRGAKCYHPVKREKAKTLFDMAD